MKSNNAKVENGFLKSNINVRRNEIVNSEIIESQTVLNFQTEIVPKQIGLMIVGWEKPLGAAITGTIIANNKNLKWEEKSEKSSVVQVSNYYGCLSQCGSVLIGTSMGNEVWTGIGNILPMANPNSINITGWSVGTTAPLSDSMNIFHPNLQEQLSPLTQVFPASNIDLESIKKYISEFKKQNPFTIVLWGLEPGPETVSKYSEIKKFEKLTLAETFVVACLEENVSMIGLNVNREDFISRGLYCLGPVSINTFNYDYISDSYKVLQGNVHAKAAVNKFLYPAEEKYALGSPDIISGLMNNLFINERKLSGNGLFLIVPVIIDLIIFAELFSRISVDGSRFDPNLSSLNHFLQTQFIQFGMQVRIENNSSLINTLMTVAGISPSLSLEHRIKF